MMVDCQEPTKIVNLQKKNLKKFIHILLKLSNPEIPKVRYHHRDPLTIKYNHKNTKIFVFLIKKLNIWSRLNLIFSPLLRSCCRFLAIGLFPVTVVIGRLHIGIPIHIFTIRLLRKSLFVILEKSLLLVHTIFHWWIQLDKFLWSIEDNYSPELVIFV